MTTATPAGRLTRVTLIGPTRRIDVVLPSDEPLGALLPEMVAMVGHRHGGDPRGFQLGLVDGTVLPPATSLRDAGVPDGAVLRVDPFTAAPPAAVVYDIPDELSDDLDRRPGRWHDAARVRTATGACVVASAFAAHVTAAQVPVWVLTAAAVVLLAAGLGAAAAGRRPAGVALLLGGTASLATTVPAWTSSWPHRWALWALGAACAVALLGVATGHRRAGLLGAGVSLALLGWWVALAAAGLPAHRSAALTAVVTVGLLGVLPRVAMVSSGLTKLDDRLNTDDSVPRPSAEAAVDAAHRGLATACVAAVLSGTAAGLVLATSDGWSVALAVLLAVVLFLRLRAFPLTAEVVSMVTAALVVVGALLARLVRDQPRLWWVAAVAALVVVLLGLLVLGHRPQSHVRARARQWADRLEGLAVLGSVPVAVGVFGVYSRLLDTF
ncbi:type VII secretion integral membrane protein EccD [Saccharothrix sp. S26]|uniref:type VII secretion integral membrane protein EccD n=1 Tax=Saccharothrix sp. S26 TaxID=2907215 RepID=UPI001F28E1F7|nr:type VII secretion integral membrane protein EccD [Saccharothrix sp. S26]MCE6996883.1 type VII secretion integral membrane protein EccD [Saccharothrix sp. S26]